MDETLKAYADKRRQEAGAPFDLHPATRQMLQGEVTRTYKPGAPASPRVSWVERVFVFWPRMAFAAACVAITITLVLMVSPREKVMEIAQTAKPVEELSRDARAAAGEQDKEQEKLMLADQFTDTPAPAAPAPTSSTAPLMPARPLDQLAKKTDETTGDLKARSELMAEARKEAAGLKLTREESVGKDGAQRSYRVNTESPPARYIQRRLDIQLGVRLQNAQETVPAVLHNFEVKQTGNAVEVVDGDGSIYVGNVVSNVDAQKRQAGQVNAPAAQAGALAGPVEQELLFYAVGTNMTLRQKVSIEANIMQVQTNSLPALNAVEPAKNQRGVSQMQNTIRGRARVGTNQEMFEFEAVPAKP